MSLGNEWMEISDFSASPKRPELVVTEAEESMGMDLLGLRSPAERISYELLDGITTVTPTVRYLSFRAWIIRRYETLGGTASRKAFRAFVHKTESALVMGNLLADSKTYGLIGLDKGRKAVASTRQRLALGKLVNAPATTIYTGPSQDLGITWGGGPVPGLTRERGVPLAEMVEGQLKGVKALHEITPDDKTQKFSRKELAEIGTRFPMDEPGDEEKSLLIDCIMPPEPQSREAARVATYCLILHLCQEARETVEEWDIFKAVTQPYLETIPTQLRRCCEGWARFVVRDMLVAVHEAAVSLVCQHIFETGGPEKRRRRGDVVAELAADDLDAGFSALGFRNIGGKDPVDRLLEATDRRLRELHRAGDINRWSGKLTEINVLEAAEPTRAGMAALPVAWLLAVRRMQPGIEDGIQGFDLDGFRGTYRIGIREVILPEVSSWRQSTCPIRHVVANLIVRSVDQHLRIAWSHLAREPWKDVSALAADGDDWIYCKDLAADEATSRLYQAVNWLGQLGLVNNRGLTRAGKTILDIRLQALGTIGGYEP